MTTDSPDDFMDRDSRSRDPLGGLSPADLLRQGAAEDTMAGEKRAAFVPPSLEEMAGIFPQFDVLELVGQGGMGAVYRVRQRELDRIVALKILPPGIEEEAGFAERFAREAKALAKLDHPGIVTIHEFGRSGGLYFIVMEFVDGVNLRRLLEGGRVSPREALAIAPQICDALQFAHDQGIVHRDIKPENILIDRRGRVNVVDFGLAKLAGGEEEAASGGTAGGVLVTQAGKVLGTPHYMAPEQIERPAEVDHRADIYALGVVFYQMLTGELPKERLEAPSKKVRVDVRLDEIVLRALEKEPELRFQQASAMKTRLEKAGEMAVLAPSRRANMWDMDYRSKAKWFGLPLLHITSGPDPETGKERVAKGIVAIGGRAKGVIALGGMASGGVACGGVATGVVAAGGVAVGVFSFGGVALALLCALGGLAAGGWVAIGGRALGYMSYGGAASGVHVLDPRVQDQVAKDFFMPWAQELVANTGLYSLSLLILAGGILPAFGILMWWADRISKRGPKGAKACGGEARRWSRRARVVVLILSLLLFLPFMMLCWLLLGYWAAGSGSPGKETPAKAPPGSSSVSAPGGITPELAAMYSDLKLEIADVERRHGSHHPLLRDLEIRMEALLEKNPALYQQRHPKIVREERKKLKALDRMMSQGGDGVPGGMSRYELDRARGDYSVQMDRLKAGAADLVTLEKAEDRMAWLEIGLMKNEERIAKATIAAAERRLESVLQQSSKENGRIIKEGDFSYIPGTIRGDLEVAAAQRAVEEARASLQTIQKLLKLEDLRITDAYRWLALVDAGHYREAQAALASLGTWPMTQEQRGETIAAIRNSLGDLLHRRFKKTEQTTSVPGLPDGGEYMVFEFETSFANDPKTIEALAMMKEDDKWKPATYYFIRRP